VTEYTFILAIDPASIGTPQQKRYAMRGGKIRTFASPRVANAKKAMCFLAKAAAARHPSAIPPHGTPIALGLKLLYAVPKSHRKPKGGFTPPEESEPCRAHWAGDCDNRAKGVIDALTDAGLWADDKDVTSLAVKKVWTFGRPRIEVTVSRDAAETDTRTGTEDAIR
jgi:Holliday junction resolvase RusA-like endonuclease